MGNNQSVDSDNENERSTYNYHENILRDAQQRCNTNAGGYESDQYFSADEGDSDRSVTPPRNRPESSSGEDCSDDSMSDNSEENVGDNEISQACANEPCSSHVNLEVSSQNKNEFLIPAVKKQAVKKSCGQCNVSRFQEHDSIGPELDTSRWLTNTSNVSERSTRQSQRSQGHVSNADNESRHVHTCDVSSPFKPINSPPSSRNVSHVSLGNSATKRRVCNQNVKTCEENHTSPKKKKTIQISPAKRRLGMLDESDSGSDEDVEIVKKKSRHGKHVASPGRIKRKGSPGVTQGECSILNRSKDSRGTEGEQHDAGSAPKIKKISTGTELVEENLMGQKRVIEINQPSADEYSSNRSERIKNLKIDHQNSIDIITHESGRGVKRLQGSAFQPIKRTLGNDTENCQTRTGKMGNSAIRNSLGKILPIRHSQENYFSSSSSPDVTETLKSAPCQAQPSLSDSTLGKNNFCRLRLKKLKPVDVNSAGIHLSHSNVGAHETVISESDTHKENQNSPAVNKSKEDDDSADLSPFKNVVLTPPSSLTSNMSCMEEGKVKRSHEEKEDDVVAMETEEPETSMDSESVDMHSRSSGHRILAKAKRLSAAAHLKNLKTNLSTFFFKRKSGNKDDHPNVSNQSRWSLYSSSPSTSGLLNQSPLSIQPADWFQSTSSPVGAVHASISDRVDFSPISNILPGASPLSTFPSSLQPNRHSISPSSLMQGKKETLRKSSSVCQTPIRTSPRLRNSGTTPTTQTAKTSNRSDDSSSDSFRSQSFSHDVQQLPQTSEFQVVHCRLSQTLDISLSMGDIAEEDRSGIVNWTDGALTHTDTVCSQKICAKAGALMRASCNSYIENKDGLLEAPDVLTTPAGGSFPRSVKALLHVTSPPSNSARLGACLLEVNANCLRFASERLSLNSLSMPLIGEGELPTQLCAEAFIDAVLIFLAEMKSLSATVESSSSLTSLHLVTVDANITDQAAEVIQARIDCVKTSGLCSEVADIRERYYGIQQDTSVLSGDNVIAETADRTKYGRPRVKRPRL